MFIMGNIRSLKKKQKTESLQNRSWSEMKSAETTSCMKMIGSNILKSLSIRNISTQKKLYLVGLGESSVNKGFYIQHFELYTLKKSF